MNAEDVVPNGGENIEIPIEGQRVSRCCVDWGIVLEFLEDRPDVTIQIGAPCRLSDGTTTSMIEPNERAGAGRAAVLVRKKVARAMALAEGTLDIRFSDGAFVIVTPDPDYEAWTMTARTA